MNLEQGTNHRVSLGTKRADYRHELYYRAIASGLWHHDEQGSQSSALPWALSVTLSAGTKPAVRHSSS